MSTSASAAPPTLAERQRALQAHIRRDSVNADLRAELFQLLALLGDWPRASDQLDLCLAMNPHSDSLVRTYRGALRAEERRMAVFCGRAIPELTDASPALEQLARALACDAAGDAAAAAALRVQAFDALPAQRGLLRRHGAADVDAGIDAEAFAWLADADSRLGPVLEVFIGERYLWVPLMAVTRIRLAPARSQCDLVWAQASLQLKGASEVAVMIPVRYCLAGLDPSQVDDASLLARETRWQPLGPNLDPSPSEHYRGIGQRMWTGDQDDYALLDVAEITFEQATRDTAACLATATGAGALHA